MLIGRLALDKTLQGRGYGRYLLIINEATGETIYSLRLNQNTFTSKIFDASVTYTVKVGEPDTDTWQEKSNVRPGADLIEYHFK